MINLKVEKRCSYYAKYVIIIICSILLNCKEDNILAIKGESILFNKFPKSDSVFFEKVFEYKKGVPRQFHIIDSSMIIFNGDHESDHFFYNYSINSGKLSNGYLKRGRGPSEAIGGFCSGITKNHLWAFDISLKKILITSKVKALSKNDNQISFNEYKLKQNYYKISLHDNINFFAVGLRNSMYKIQEIDLVLDSVKNEFGKFENIPKHISLDAYKDAFKSYIYLKPDASKVALAYRYTDVIEIYDLKTRKNIVIKGPIGFDVDLHPMKTDYGFTMETTKKTRKAFLNGAVNDDYIYIISSGRYEKDNWSYGNYVYVYDWDGNPIKKLILDRDVNMLAVSENNKNMYSYDTSTGNIITTNIE